MKHSIAPRDRMASRRGALLLAATLLLAAACVRLDGADHATAAAGSHYDPVHVDSVFPLEEEIRRFRAALSGPATGLTGGALSREDLVATFMAALQTRDVTTLDRLALTPAEFIDLYYPGTRFTKRPYQLSPQIVWFQLENYGSKGRNRALARFGGRDLGYRGHDCASQEAQAASRLHGGCVVYIDDAAGGTRPVSLFGLIIEHDASYKFISYANPL